MSKLQLRVVTESATSHRWMVVDHIWDGISEPMAIADHAYPSAHAAQEAGEVELRRIESEPLRE